jgi:hypothetical protein
LDERFVGIESVAERLGRGLARTEWKIAFGSLTGSQRLDLADSDVNDRLAAGIRLMATAGFTTTLIVVPYNWRLHQALSLNRGRENVPSGVQRFLGRQLLGSSDDILVVVAFDISDDSAFLIDVGQYCRWYQWVRPGDADVEVSIHIYDEEEALRAVEANDQLFSNLESSSLESRAWELRKHFNLIVRERFRFEVRDRRAAVKIDLPEELLRP